MTETRACPSRGRRGWGQRALAIAALLQMGALPMAADRLVLENSRTRIAFDGASGELVELSSLPDGVSRLAPGARAHPIRILIWDREKGVVVPLPGGEPAFRGGRVTRRDGRRTLALSYASAGESVAAECEVNLGRSEVSAWRVRVSNHSSFPVVGVAYPNVPAQIGVDSGDDVLIFPLVYGERQVNPLKVGGAKAPYPGRASMAWMDLYGAEGGLYLASHDRTCQSTDVSAVPHPSREARALLMSFTRFGLIAPGQTWESPDTVVAPHAGDWHWGADQYRRWRATWMKRPPTPRWLRESDGWLGMGYHATFEGRLEGPYETTLPHAADQAAALGLSHVQIWGQMIAPGSGKHNCARFVAADPAQGGGEALARANRGIRARGLRVGYYKHAWASSSGLDELEEASVRLLPPGETEPSWKVTDPDSQWMDADGKITTHDTRLMCPGAPRWQEHVRFWVLDRYVRSYEATGMYLDVLSIAHQRCFSDRHGPLHVGDWGRDALRLLQSLREEGRRVRPDFFLASEGVCDAYGQHVDVQLISRACMLGSWVPHPYPEVIRYACPDLLLLEGFANGLGPVPETGETATPEHVINHCHLLGNRYDYYDQARPGAREYLARALALRRQIKGFLYSARFMDDVGMSVSPGLRAKWFAAARGPRHGALVTLVNAEQRAGLEVSLAGVPEGVGASATACVLDGPPRPLAVTRAGDTVTFTAPGEVLSAVLLHGR